jgi:hypothetical protein
MGYKTADSPVHFLLRKGIQRRELKTENSFIFARCYIKVVP